MAAGKASAKFFYYYFGHSKSASDSLRAEVLYLSSMTYPEGWMSCSTFGILYPVDLSNVTN